MKQKFHLEIALLGIAFAIMLVSSSGFSSFEAFATINTINGDGTADQKILRQPGNTTVTNSTGSVTVGIGSNVILKNKSQTYTAGAKQTFGPFCGAPGCSAGVNLGVSTNPFAPTAGDLWYQSTLNALVYGGLGTGELRTVVGTDLTQTLSNKKLVDASDGFVSLADQTKQILFSIAKIATGHTDTWTFPNANSTFMGTTITNDLGQVGKLIFGSNNLIIRNPTSTFATTLAGGAVTANQTLKMPAITATDTLATLGLGQTFTGTDTFNSLTLGGAENANNNQINSLATPTHSTDAQVANHLGLLGSLVTATCANNQVLQYQVSNSTWICGTSSGSGVPSVNSFTSAINIVRQSGNTTITNSSGTITVGLGVNPVITNGAAQTVTKGLILNSLTLGGNENAGSFRITSLGTPTVSSDAQVANHLGLLGFLVRSACANNQILQYQISNSTWICGTPSGGGGITSINGDTTPAQNINGVTGNTTASTTAGTTTINLGTNAVVTGGAAQTISKQMTFSSNVNMGGNITSTAASGKTFKISAPSGVAICIGMGC